MPENRRAPRAMRGPDATRPSTFNRLLLLVLVAWALAMVVPSFYQVTRPLASFGFSADNNGTIIDVTKPFAAPQQSPATQAGLAVGDRIDLSRMSCAEPGSRACAALVMVLGGSGGLQYTWPGREIDLAVLPARGGAPRMVHMRAALAPLGWADRLVLLANTVAGVMFVLAASRLVWLRPGVLTWGFFLYAIWFNPGQTYAYYALLQFWPLAPLAEQAAEALAVGAAYAGLLLFALRFPADAPDESWRPAERLAPWVGVVCALLTLLPGANLFGRPTEPYAAASYLAGYAVNATVLAVLLLRRRGLHPRDEQRMRWVIAGAAIGLPSYIFASICQATGLVEEIWGSAPSQTAVGLLFLVQGVLGYFVWAAVSRPRVVSVAIPLRHGTVTAVLTLALGIPVMFVHERVAQYHEELHLPEWIWPLVVAPIMLIVLQRLHEVGVDLVDHAFNRTYHRARRGLQRAGRALETAGSFTAIDRVLVEDAARSLRLASAAVFRVADGTVHRTEPAVGWEGTSLRVLQRDTDALVFACLTDRRPIRLPPVRRHCPGWPEEEQAPCLAVPVCGNAPEGVAVVLYGLHRTGSDITEDECDVLHALAVQAGRAYDRVEAETLRREVRILRARLSALSA